MAGKSERLKVHHQQRSDTAANWTANNPVLLAGEMGVESDTFKFKFGDGTSRWSTLPYVNTAGGTGAEGDKTLSDVLAASDCSLEARVTALERTLTAVLSGDAVIPALQVRELGVWGSNNLILTGSGAPTKAPDRAGQFFIDTASDAVYKSTGNAAVSDWKNL